MLKKLIITGLGTGYLPIAPGTWGSAAVAGVWLLVLWLSGGQGHYADVAMAAIAVLGSFGCVAFGEFAEKHFGKKDPGQVTLDEWAGQAVTYFLLPIGQPAAAISLIHDEALTVAGVSVVIDWRPIFIVAAVGFLAFRLMDIVKPPPARRMERLHAGWGILVDDLIAGVYANILCQLVLRLWLLT